MPYDILKSTEVFDGTAVRLVVYEILLPNGAIAKREIVHNRDAAVILPVGDDGDVYLVRQYRHSVRQMVLEVPAGIIDAGETAEQCALRELEEEVGLRAGHLVKVCEYHDSIGICSGKMHLFVATELTPGVQKLDPEEFITIEKHNLDNCKKMIQSGEIIDGKTILAIFAYTSDFVNRLV